MSLTLTVGDTAPVLAGTVSANLTGATAVVHIRRPDGTVVSRTATHSGTAGAWTLPLVVGDLTVRGLYLAEVEVTFSDASIETFAKDSSGVSVSFDVRDQYA